MGAASEVRAPRSDATREALLTVAERLFAEQGVFAVSNRQVSEAAGQGNNTAVNYHFGTKTDLILAIAARHGRQIERHRTELIKEFEGSTNVRDWVTCLVRPSTSHLAALGVPSWYARFNAQILTDPNLRVLVYDEGWQASPSFQKLMSGLGGAVSDLPIDLRRSRFDMGRHVMVHMCAERELSLSRQGTEGSPTWDEFAIDLIDGVVGLWQAPVTRWTIGQP